MMTNRTAAFSMVEVTLALGIVAFALLAIFGLLPVGLTASRNAADDTRTSMVAQDAYNRVRASLNRGVYFDGTFARVPLSIPATSSPVVALPAPWTGGVASDQTVAWFYDANGVNRPEALTNGDFSNVQYRVDVKLGRTWHATTAILPVPDPDYLRPVVVQITWPVNTATGAALNLANTKTFTFTVRKP